MEGWLLRTNISMVLLRQELESAPDTKQDNTGKKTKSELQLGQHRPRFLQKTKVS